MREYLQFTPEVTWGVYDAAGVHTGVQMTDSNAFTLRPVPQVWEIRSACSTNRRLMRGTYRTQIQGAFNNIVVFGSQAVFWATMLNLAGNPLDAPSYTVDHAIQMEDAAGTKVLRRYLGCKVSQWQFSAASDTQLLRLNLNLIGKSFVPITTTDFPEPAPGTCAPDAPFVLENASTFTMGTAGARTEFDRFQATGVHVMDPTYFNSAFITRLGVKSRNVDASVVFPYIVTADRSDLEAQSAHPASCTFTLGTHTLAFNFQAVNYTTAALDQLDYNRVFLQGITFADYFDPAAGTDFSLSAT
jgi:hypothetical protein